MRARLVGGLAVALLAALAGCTDTCLLNGECPGDTLCLEGECRTPCTADPQCPLVEFCIGGGCRALAPGERPPCRDDGGCFETDGGDMAEPFDPGLDAAPDTLGDGPMIGDAAPDSRLDAGLDGAPADAMPDGQMLDGQMLDGQILDGLPLDGQMLDGLLDGQILDDASLDQGALDGAPADQGPPDQAQPDLGPLDAAPIGDGDLIGEDGVEVDLTGLYAVTTTVVIATGGALSAGDELRHIHHLTLLGATRYRIEVFATDGALEHQAEVDLDSPDGPGRYQFEYARPIPSPDGCEGLETRFQRGRFDLFDPGYRLRAGEERDVAFDGPDCLADGYLVRTDTVWIPLPPP